MPKIKPRGRRSVLVTFLPPEGARALKSDELVWKEIEPTMRSIRTKLFRETYPASKTNA